MTLNDCISRFLARKSVFKPVSYLACTAVVGLSATLHQGCAPAGDSHSSYSNCRPDEGVGYAGYEQETTLDDFQPPSFDERAEVEEVLAWMRETYPDARPTEYLLALAFPERLGSPEANESSFPRSFDLSEAPPYDEAVQRYAYDLIPESLLQEQDAAYVQRACTFVCQESMTMDMSELEAKAIEQHGPDWMPSGDLDVLCQSVEYAEISCSTHLGGTAPYSIDNCPVAGRRPPQMQQATDDILMIGEGGWWSQVCHLEQAAVHAFVHLSRELRALDAPEALVSTAVQAAREEVEHVHLTRAMATRHGAEVPDAVCPETALRSLFEIALDNAAEGCIREAFAALQTRWQARHVDDANAASVLERIGLDETGHGEFSWQLHDWCMSRLGPDERAQVLKAQQDALEELRASAQHVVAYPGLGLPDAEAQRELVEVLAEFAGSREVAYA